MSTDLTDRSAALQQLSALADGELDGAEVVQACLQWRGDTELRSSWHAYQLIGDVLRSEDLGCDPAHDAGFIAALRLRLADEPVVLAPPPVTELPEAVASADAAARRRRWAWMAPSTVAAGFVAVAGVVFVTRGPDPGSFGAGTPIAEQSAPAFVAGDGPSARAAPRTASVADSQALVANGKLIRDVRLDRYLSAHKEFAGTSVLGVPSGFLRNATAEAADR